MSQILLTYMLLFERCVGIRTAHCVWGPSQTVPFCWDNWVYFYCLANLSTMSVQWEHVADMTWYKSVSNHWKLIITLFHVIQSLFMNICFHREAISYIPSWSICLTVVYWAVFIGYVFFIIFVAGFLWWYLTWLARCREMSSHEPCCRAVAMGYGLNTMVTYRDTA